MRRVSLDRVRDLDGPIPKGIDGVYEFSSPPPKYVITEVKMNTTGSASWKPVLKATKYGGKQMGQPWVEAALKTQLGDAKALEIVAQGYEKALVTITKNGNPVLLTLDENANVLQKSNIIIIEK